MKINFKISTSIIILLFFCTYNYIIADPPVPDPEGTDCPMVQCMVIDSVECVDDFTVDIYFSTLNWFNTIPDNGLDEIRIIPTIFSDEQVTMLQAVAPSGWVVSSFSSDSIVFTGTAIPDVGLCSPCASGPLGNCGNIQGGFSIRIGDINSDDCFTANWKHYSQGIDNGDVMNFGAMSWCFDSCPIPCSSGTCTISDSYSNNSFPPFPLKIILDNFQGFAETRGNRVQWSTLSEINSDYIEVQSSPNGNTKWKNIGVVATKGESKVKVDYELFDYNPYEVTYYRLNAVDKEGISELSKIIKIRRSDVLGNMSLAPNPAMSSIAVQTTSSREEVGVICVMDKRGQVMIERNVNLIKGLNTMNLNLNKLKSGLYVFALKTENGMQIEKFIKY